jgi:tetratricopeptide (TPR) repeat protein
VVQPSSPNQSMNKEDILVAQLTCDSIMGNSDSLKQGKYLFASGKYEEAIKNLNRVIQKDPKDAEAWIFKGRALFYQHKYSDAIRCYEKVIDLDPKNEDAWTGKIQCFDKLIDQSAKNIDAWDDKIRALISLGRYEQAAQTYDKAPEMDLRSAPWIWNWKGDGLRRQGRHEDAIKFYNKTLKQDPENEDAWISKGKALYLLGKGSESIKCFDQAIELNSKNAKVWAMKSAAFKSIYMYVEAEEAMQEAKKLGFRE